MRVAGTGAGHGALVEAIAAESAQKSHKKYTPFLPSCQFFFFFSLGRKSGWRSQLPQSIAATLAKCIKSLSSPLTPI